MQNAIARYQSRQLIGRDSLALGTSVHVTYGVLHFSEAMRAVVSLGRLPFHPGSQPPACIMPLRARPPAPAAGGLARVPIPDVTNGRNRPTVTSNLSSRNELMVAG